jgi:hypothetical protein
MPGWLANRVFDSRNPQSVAFRLRARRIKPLVEILEAVHAIHGQVRLLDFGGTPGY